MRLRRTQAHYSKQRVATARVWLACHKPGESSSRGQSLPEPAWATEQLLEDAAVQARGPQGVTVSCLVTHRSSCF